MIVDATMLQATRELRDEVSRLADEEITTRAEFSRQHGERMERIDQLQDMADDLMRRVTA